MNSRVANSSYTHREGNGTLRGVPRVEDVSESPLRRGVNSPSSGEKRRTRFQWRRVLAVLPGIGASALPVGACPACWPAYAGVLSSLGFGFLLDSTYLLPLMALFIGLALVSLAYRGKTRHGYGAFAIGALAAVIVLVGKFVLSSDLLLYLGLALLVGASLWNAWPKKKAARSSCPACAVQVQEVKPSSAEHGG